MFLPEDFEDKMKALLKNEYQQFIQGYSKENHYSLRINTLKANINDILKKELFTFSPVPWCDTGFYYPREQRPGRHSLHHAGIFYIQEASAMAVAQVADIQKGEKVLDLCAAPGGKTTQIAAKLNGTGILVTNEIVQSRAKILLQNTERMGIKNAIVLNEDPRKLEKTFAGFFDKIIVDAPCSGEGMFRKEPQVAKEWSLQQVEICSARQQLILESAAKMVAPRGKIIYSTCTFSPEENEITVENFLQNHSEFEIEASGLSNFFSPGRPEWSNGKSEYLKNTMRLFPHKINGEGHFIAVLKNNGNNSVNAKTGKLFTDKKSLASFLEFKKKHLKNIDFENTALIGDNLYSVPAGLPDLKGLKVLRSGLHLGEVKKDRFEPSHALAMALKSDEVVNFVDFDCESKEILSYLKGEALPYTTDINGWCLITSGGYSVGWAKYSNGILKNHYPKGLRIMTV